MSLLERAFVCVCLVPAAWRIKGQRASLPLQVWGRVEAQFPTRQAVIDNLQRGLEAGEGERGRSVGAALLQLVRTLTDIAHVSEGEAERVVEAEALALNRSALASRRAFAQLAARLHVADIQLHKAKRQAFDAAVADWRALRTRHAMDVFVARVRSAEFAAPPARQQMMQALRTQEQTAHASIFGALVRDTAVPPALTSVADVIR